MASMAEINGTLEDLPDILTEHLQSVFMLVYREVLMKVRSLSLKLLDQKSSSLVQTELASY